MASRFPFLEKYIDESQPPIFQPITKEDDLEKYPLMRPDIEELQAQPLETIESEVPSYGSAIPNYNQYKTKPAQLMSKDLGSLQAANIEQLKNASSSLDAAEANRSFYEDTLSKKAQDAAKLQTDFTPSMDYAGNIKKLQDEADLIKDPRASKGDDAMAALISLGASLLGGEAGALTAPKSYKEYYSYQNAKEKEDAARNAKLRENISNRMTAVSKLKEQDINAFDKVEKQKLEKTKFEIDIAKKLLDEGRITRDQYLKYYDDKLKSVVGIGEKLAVEPPKIDAAETKAKLGVRAAQSKPPTEGERKAAGYLGMLKRANEAIDAVGGKDGNRLPSLKDPAFTYKSEVMAGDAIGSSITQNLIKDPAIRKQIQAETDWALTTLRDESGAAIGRAEAIKQLNRYFGRYGDTPEILAEKKAARLQKEEGLRIMSGKAAPAQIIKTEETPQMTREEKIKLLKQKGYK